MEFLDERIRGELTRAWYFGMMFHMDPKKYPKKPDLLWNKDADVMSFEHMKAVALAWARNGQEFRNKEKVP